MRFKEININSSENFDKLIYCYLTSSLTKDDYKRMNVIKGERKNGIEREEVLMDVFSSLLMLFHENSSPHGLVYFLSDGVVYQLDKKIKKHEELILSVDNLSDKYKIVDVICSPTSLIKEHKHEGSQFDPSLRLLTEIIDNSIIINVEKCNNMFFLLGGYTEVEVDAFAILKVDNNSAEGNWRKAVELFRENQYRSVIEHCNRAYDRALRGFLENVKNTEELNIDDHLLQKLDNINSIKLSELVRIFNKLIKERNGIELLGNIREIIIEMNKLRNTDTHSSDDIDKLLTKENVEKYIIATFLLIRYFSLKIPFQTQLDINKYKEQLFSEQIKHEGYYGIAFYGINKQIISK